MKALLDKTLPQKMENKEQKLHHLKVNVTVCLGKFKKIKIFFLKKSFTLFPHSKYKKNKQKDKSILQLRTTGERYETLTHSSYKDQKK